MSLINKVLRDLDKRQAVPGGGDPGTLRAVKAQVASGHEWFWRSVSLLVVIALGWVAWVVYQIQPRPLATELAEQAAEQAKVRASAKPPAQVAVAPKPAPVAPAAPAEPAKPAAEAPKPAAEAAKAAVVEPAKPVATTPPVAAAAKITQPIERLRLAPSIETPIGEPRKQAEAKPAQKLKVAPAEKSTVGAKASDKPRVERRDRALTNEERAETEFRRAVDLLKRGRALEAEAGFNAALKADPRHRGARQALVALAFERSELESARRLLSEGLAVDPAQADFAVALARIYVEEGQLQAALAALQPSAADASDYPEFYILRGTILQRLRRPSEAAEAYRAALQIQARLPQAWIGLGMSLESLEKRAEAAEAFKRALVAGPVSADVRSFAEQRIRALR